MILRTLVLGILALSLSACNISGSGQKGPFNAGSNVSVTQLNNQSLPIASTTLTTQVSGSQGAYSVDRIQWDGWTEVSVSGTYFDEFTGSNGVGSLTLRAITRKDQRYDTANVHVFSHLAAARIQQRVANGQNRNQAWKATQQEMKGLFGFQRVSRNYHRGVEQLSLLAGTGSFRKDNANLLLFTGSFLAIGGNAASLQLLVDDFADDAKFNGVGSSIFNAIAIKGGATGLLTTLSNNLKSRGTRNPPNNGDMRSLPKWVIVDAGDVTPPVISILGDDPVEIEVGASYVDAGATATDDVDEVVNVIAVDGSDVIDTSEAGTYTVTYSATDAANNTSTATRTVIVTAVADTTAPVITLNGQNTITIVVGTSYVDEGATALDDVDGEVAATAINGSDVIDTSVPATHTVTYRATDIAGNSATATRTVIVEEAPDNTPPTLTLLGDNPDIIEVDIINEVPVPYQDPGYIATDDRDEVVDVIVDGLNVIDRSVLGGSYTITYTASDVAGNETIVTRTVNVVDTTAPVIELTGDNPHTITVDSNEVPAPYQDLGATVTDNYDDELSYGVDISVVDTGNVGTYTLTYTASDSSGNEAVSVEREVIVNPAPNEAPEVNAGEDVSVLINTGVTLTGSATDSDGTIESYSWTDQNGTELATTASFEYTSATVGVHTLTFSATDDDGVTSSDTVNVTVSLPGLYQIVLISDITEPPRNLDPALFVQGLLLQASVTDGNGNPLEDPVITVDTSAVDLTEVGEYIAIYSYTDPYERIITKEITVVVVNHPPQAQEQSVTVAQDSSNNAITLVGTDNNLGDTLTFTTTQPANGTLGGTAPNVTYTPNADYSGNDNFTFTVSDGIESSTATVNITVTAVNDLPLVNAGADTTVEVNQPVTLTGTASDSDGTIVSYSWTENGTEIATTASFSYTPTTVSTHTLTLTVTDDDGATATDTVVVTATETPNQAPVVSVGSTSIDLEIHTSLTLTGTATDSDGTIVSSGWVIGDQPYVDTIQYRRDSLGVSTLTYTAVDNDGASTSATVEINVFTNDTEAPEITLNGDNPQTVLLGAEYQDLGATATDNQDPNPECCIVLGTVDTSQLGTYILTYYADDGSENIATQTRTVHVVSPDITPPVITIGSAEVTINQGDVFTDDVSATDNVDGDITANVVIGGDTVNTNSVPGTIFTITYDVSDAAGNPATQVTRTVTIISIDQTIPELSEAEIQEYLDAINNARSVGRTCGANGEFPAVEPVTWSDKLYKAAYEHSQDMAESNTFSHDGSGAASDWSGFALNKQSSVRDRIENYAYEWTRYSENIAAGTSMDTAQEAIDGWLTSDGHCSNIMDPNVTEVGMATSANQNADYVNYWTQNFGKPVSAPVQQATVNARITTPVGIEVEGVSVVASSDVGNISTVSNANGTLGLELQAEQEYVLKLDKAGYATQVVPVRSPVADEEISLDITMIPRGQPQIFDVEVGATLEGADGALVTVGEDSFVDSNGQAVESGDIELTITSVDVSNPSSLSAFPGEFSGTQMDNTETPIISLGTVEYKFTQNGQELQLAPDSTADIRIPIYIRTYPDGSAIEVDDEIPLWSLNEQTGIWLQESIGDRIVPAGFGLVVASSASPTGMALEATVDHFTWWNADVPMNQKAEVIISVFSDDTGSALIKTRTTANIPYNFNSSDTVVSVGGSTGSLPIPSNVVVCFWAELSFTNGNNATTNESCITAASGSTNNVTLETQGGELNIVASRDNVSTRVNVPAAQIKIQPTTSESAVSYEIVSGSLPSGVSMTEIDATTAVISGIPTEIGVFSIEVEGVNGDGEKFVIAFAYEAIEGVDLTSWTTGAYESNEDRSEVLSISDATELVVTVVGEVEEGYDYIYIYDQNNNQVRELTGTLNEEFIVTGASIRARLTSDSSVTASGVTVTISLNVKPSISLLGEEVVVVDIGENYIDAGATALDPQEGDITANIITTGLPIDTSVGGIYTITYNVSDAEGNAASEIVRTVQVGSVTTWFFGNGQPHTQELSISGAQELRVTVVGQRLYGESFRLEDENGNFIYVEPSSENEITGVVTYDADFLVSGSSITASTSNGIPMPGITVTISISQKPKIILLGDETVTIRNGETYIDAGATASDTQDGDITADIVTTGLPINTSVGGAYTVTYDVTDSEGNVADQVTRIVNVGIDKFALIGSYDSANSVSEVVISPDQNTALLIEIYVENGTQFTTTEILDISNPLSPILLGSFEGGKGLVFSPDGTKIYYSNYANSTSKIEIADVTDPASIVNLGSYNVQAFGDIAISSDGSKLYAADGRFLRIIEISDSENPSLLGTYSPGQYYEDAANISLSSDDTLVFMSMYSSSGGNDYLLSIDVTDSTSPVLLDSRNHGSIYDIALSSDDSKAYVTGRNEIEIVNISNPSSLSYNKIISIGSSFHTAEISKDESRAYSGDTYTGIFSSVDISGSEGVLASIDLATDNIKDVTLSSDGSRAFVAAGENGLKIVDIQAAELLIQASPSSNVAAYLNIEMEQINIRTLSAQSSVSYTIESGTLPAGLSLTSTGDTTAMISGTPVEIGTFAVTVQGTNADGEIASIQLQFTVGETQPPVLIGRYFYEYDSDIFIDYNDHNTGGAVDSWSLLGGCGSESWVTLNATTGEIVASQQDPNASYCTGTIRAENAGGFSEANITIEIAFDDEGGGGVF